MSVRLSWSLEADDFEFSEAWIARLEQLLECAAEHEQITDGEVSLSFVDDEMIRELNEEYRGINRATDVLSFAMHEQKEQEEPEIWYEDEVPNLLGDIVISLTTAQRQATEYGHSLERELGFLFVHGFLHLLGYDHENDEAEQTMFELQEKILLKAGLSR